MIWKTKVIFCEEPEGKHKRERRAVVEYINDGVYLTIVDDEHNTSMHFKFSPDGLVAAVNMVCEAEGLGR